MHLRYLIALTAASLAWAQPPAALTYTGTPLKLGFECDQDHLEDLGMFCTEDEPCILYTEFSAIHASPGRLMLAGNIHTGSATASSLLLRSEDGGATWTEPYTRVRLGSLEQIVFSGADNGWISGQIIRSIPRDPFFLVTKDGGKSWRRRSIYTEATIAQLEGFRFEGPQAGIAILSAEGRSQRWLTTNGGDTWQMSEVSAARMQAPPAPEPNPEWRIRADAKLKAHVLERRDGTRFVPVTSFLVEAGRCTGGAEAGSVTSPLNAQPE